MSITSFDELYVEELRDLYSAESQLVKALPKVAKACSSPELAQAVTDHLEQTKGHVQRLEQIFKELGEKPTGHTCKAMQGLIEEGDEVIAEVEKGPVRDAAIIGGAQKIEHYEIAGYGTARTFAELLGHADHVELLQSTLEEEATCDDNLTELAMSSINDEAAEEGQDGSMGEGKATSGTATQSKTNGKSTDSKANGKSTDAKKSPSPTEKVASPKTASKGKN